MPQLSLLPLHSFILGVQLARSQFRLSECCLSGEATNASIVGQLCIGLAWIDLWGPLVMGLIEQWLLPIETALAYIPLSLFGSFSLAGNVILGAKGHDVAVLEPCSAFRNTITMAFIWLALMKILRLDFRLRHFCILAMGLAVVVVLNTAQIGVMAYSYDQCFFAFGSRPNDRKIHNANRRAWSVLLWVARKAEYDGVKASGAWRWRSSSFAELSVPSQNSPRAASYRMATTSSISLNYPKRLVRLSTKARRTRTGRCNCNPLNVRNRVS